MMNHMVVPIVVHMVVHGDKMYSGYFDHIFRYETLFDMLTPLIFDYSDYMTYFFDNFLSTRVTILDN